MHLAIQPAATGRPSYHPSVLLKLYIYGYLNRVQSSRRLEREAGRNVEVMWLLGRLAPDHKTIADFRKDNGLALRKVCARFVELCREMGLLATASVAIDGSKFKAVNNRRCLTAHLGKSDDDPYPPQRIGQRLRTAKPQEEWQRLQSVAKIAPRDHGKGEAHGRRECSAADFAASLRALTDYWITRSARLSTSGGIVTPMSRAVLRFTISS